MNQADRDNLTATMHDHRICILIPTYNNAGTLAHVITETLRYADDIIIVNDGSTDSTANILDSFGERITAVTHAANKGKGSALKSGFLKARELGFDYAITLDSDDQHYPDDIPLFVRTIVENPGAMVIGERDLSDVDINGKSSFANKFSNFWFCVQTGRNLKDTQTGYRAYPLKRLHGLGLLTSRYEAELELLVLAAWNSVKIIAIPIKVYYPPQSERVSHFRPAKDFTRISILNTILCFGAILYGIPVRTYNSIRRKTLFKGEFRPFTRKNGEKKDAATTIDRILRSAYGFSFFMFWSLAVFTPFSAIYFGRGKKTEKKSTLLHRMLQKISRLIVKALPGARTSYINETGETFRKPALIICNHQSHLDLPVIMAMHPRLVFLTNDWVWNSPYVGRIVRNAEYLPVSEGMETLLPKLRALRDRGYSTVVFPEGTRSADCSILRFHQGAFYLAEELELDIIPMALHGAGHYLPKYDCMFRKGQITLEILGRVSNQEAAEMGSNLKRASHFRKIIRNRYDKTADRTETPSYFRDTVMLKYAYRGWQTTAEAKKLLKSAPELDKLISEVKSKARPVYVINSGIGVVPLLIALSAKNIEVHGLEEDIEKFNTAENTPALPRNLRFTHTVFSKDYDVIPAEATVIVVGEHADIERFMKFTPTLIRIKS